jgi:hypothetical protein
MNRSATLKLYKEILFSAKRFPSVKRAKIIEEIRVGFRESRNVTDPAQLQKLQAVAIDGLEKLSMYSHLSSKKTSAWSVTMDRQPMPNFKE